MMRSYLIRDVYSSELVGYFSVKAGLISVNEVHTVEGVTFDTIPGVEIANFAVNEVYQDNHPDLKCFSCTVSPSAFGGTVKQLTHSYSRNKNIVR